MTRRQVTQIVLGCFLILLLLAPVYESFDRWDGFSRSGNDTVLNLIEAVAFCGLVLVAAKSLLSLLSALVNVFLSVCRLFCVRSCPLVLTPRSTIGESPPPLFISPLRI